MEYSASDSKYTYYIFAGTKSVAEETNGQKIFYHRDHLGSTRALTDQNKKLVGLCKYGPWGNLESTNEYDEGVINGDFELSADGQALKWLPVNDSSALPDCSYAPTSGIQGSAALRIDRKTGNTSWWENRDIYASPDTDYQLTGYYLSGGSSAHAVVQYYDQAGVLIATHDTSALGSTDTWKAFTLNSHSPANAYTMRIRLMFGDEAGQAVRFDGIRLKVPGLAGKYDFTGKREDEGTGLKYFGARFYDADSARFITLDPARDGNNWYVYCENNPIRLIDLTGKYPSTANIGQTTAQHGESLSADTAPGAYSYSATANIGQATATIGEGFVSYTTCTTYGNNASVTTSSASQFGISISTTTYNMSPEGSFSKGTTSITITSTSHTSIDVNAINRALSCYLSTVFFATFSASCFVIAGVTVEVPYIAVPCALVGYLAAYTGLITFTIGTAELIGAFYDRDLVEEKFGKLGGIAVDCLPGSSP